MLTNEEIKKKIDYNNNLIEGLMDPCTFTLNEAICKLMKENDFGYGAINHPVDSDPVCGYVGVIKDVCAGSGRKGY